MGNNSHKPVIRFQGFTDAWEQRKLGDISDSYSGGTPTVGETEYYGGDIPFIRSAEINSDSTELFLTTEGLNNSSAKMVKKGDILYALYGATSGETGLAQIDGAINQAILDIKPHEGYVASFIMYWLRKSKKNIIGTFLQGGQGNLSGNIVTSLMIDCPNYEEQKKIGKLLMSLDNLITLHQRKYEKLITVKKSMLDKMFPRDGSNNPEIRFIGFTDPWEQCKLNSLMNFSNGFNGSSDLYGGGVPYISVMDILNNDLITYECIRGKVDIDEKTLSRFSVDYGDVLFQRSSENVEDAGSSNVYIGKKTVAFGGFVIRGKKQVDYDVCFMKNMLDSKAVRNQITSKAQGAQHINVSQETLSDVIVFMPSIAEQRSIGQLFFNISKSITLHQLKLEKLKNIKQSLLQNMFV